MKMTKGDSGTEDIIRAFVNASVAEAHAKTNYEKLISELEQGTVDTDDDEVLARQMERVENTLEQLKSLCRIRRNIMMRLFDSSPGNENEWCMIKHLAITENCLFEAFQAGGDCERLWLDAHEEFIKAMSDFLGMEITPCSSCFSEMIKEADDASII